MKVPDSPVGLDSTLQLHRTLFSFFFFPENFLSLLQWGRIHDGRTVNIRILSTTPDNTSYDSLFIWLSVIFFRRRGFQIEIKKLVFLKRDRNGMFSMILYSFGEV